MTSSGSYSISLFQFLRYYANSIFLTLFLFFKSKHESYCALLMKDRVVVQTILHFPLSNDKAKHTRILRGEQKAKWHDFTEKRERISQLRREAGSPLRTGASMQRHQPRTKRRKKTTWIKAGFRLKQKPMSTRSSELETWNAIKYMAERRGRGVIKLKKDGLFIACTFLTEDITKDTAICGDLWRGRNPIQCNSCLVCWVNIQLKWKWGHSRKG